MSVSFSTVIQRTRAKPTHAISQQLREAILKMPVTNVSALPNGFKIASEANPNAKFATIGLYIDSGSKYDLREVQGTARVLEKALFQGTTTQSRQQIAKAVEEIGGQLMVETGREHSYIAFKTTKDNVPKAAALLADLVRNARLADEDIAAAKAIVTKQRHEAEERVDEICLDNLHMCAFDSTAQSLGSLKDGDASTLKAISKDTLNSFRNEHFAASRMALVGAGAVDQTVLEKTAKSLFGDMANGVAKKKVASRLVGGDIRLWNLRFKTSHVAWAVEGPGANCEDTIPLDIMVKMVGNYHRSEHELGNHAMHRVFKVYSSMDFAGPTLTPFPEQALEVANGFSRWYEDTGLFGMYLVGRPYATSAGTDNTMHDIMQYSMAEWCRMSQKTIGDHELEQGKINLKSQLLFNQDGASNTFKDIGRQVFHHGRRVPLDELYARIDDVSAENVMEVMQHYFYARRPVVSIMGHVYPMPNYDWMSYWTFKWWY